VAWAGQLAGGTPAASGLYLVRLRTESGVRTRKVALLR
jgi:hypothetical protein